MRRIRRAQVRKVFVNLLRFVLEFVFQWAPIMALLTTLLTIY